MGEALVPIVEPLDGDTSWHLAVSATQFTTSTGPRRTLALTGLTVGDVAGQGIVSPPPKAPLVATLGSDARRQTAGYGSLSRVVPAAPVGSPAPPSLAIFTRALSAGQGRFTIRVPFALVVPANSYAGIYTATVTITVASGPP